MFANTMLFHNKPSIVAFCGAAGLNEKELLDTFVKPGSLRTLYDPNENTDDPFCWMSASFAFPLRDIYGARVVTQGENMEDRVLYQISKVLHTIWGDIPQFGSISFDTFTELTKDLASLPTPLDGSKPRRFLYLAGEKIRQVDPAAFAVRLNQDIRSKTSSFCSYQEEDMNEEANYDLLPTTPIFIIPDLKTEEEIGYLDSLSDIFDVYLVGFYTPFEKERRAYVQRTGLDSGKYLPNELVVTPDEDAFDAIIEVDQDMKYNVEEAHNLIRHLIKNP